MPTEAVLVAPAARDARAVVLLLHGGSSTSEAPATRLDPAVLRMLPIGAAIGRRVPAVVVARLRHRYRGWNEPYAHPVGDTRDALDRLAARYGNLPVVLVGHSMGGRTSVHAAGHPRVAGVVALAPWLSEADPVDTVAGIRVAVLHGERDRVTDPRASLRWTHRATRRAAGVVWVGVRGAGHAMLLRHRTFDRLTVEFVRAIVANEPPRGVLSTAWRSGPEAIERRV